MGIEVAAVVAAAAVIGTAVTAYSVYQQGQAQSAAADYQSQVAAHNAQLNQINAANARKDAAQIQRTAAQEQDNQIRRVRQAVGSQVAGAAAHGLSVNEGTALDLQSDTATLGGQAIGNVAAQGDRDAAKLNIRAFNFEQGALANLGDASAASAKADSAATAGALGAFGTTVNGLGSAYGGYNRASSYSDMAQTGQSFEKTRVVS